MSATDHGISIVPVEFGWSASCISELELHAILDAYFSSNTACQRTLSADANIGCIVDTRGLRCPFPVREMRSAFMSLSKGARIVLLTDDPVAAIDIPHAVMQDSNHLRLRTRTGNVDVFLVERS
ncbi:sulfurtransferase TusA family protein [Labrys sp. (in: a-proteobacteria)]|uniref:sulfurtransferase TusA family protein n=1 Tax=Labrys sp. (in: a-proteobacteria) TaxID=1917972 RepID=UPI0039E3010F